MATPQPIVGGKQEPLTWSTQVITVRKGYFDSSAQFSLNNAKGYGSTITLTIASPKDSLFQTYPSTISSVTGSKSLKFLVAAKTTTPIGMHLT